MNKTSSKSGRVALLVKNSLSNTIEIVHMEIHIVDYGSNQMLICLCMKYVCVCIMGNSIYSTK